MSDQGPPEDDRPPSATDADGGAPKKTFKFPTAFTVLAHRPAARLDRVVLRPGRRLQDRSRRVAGAGHLPRAAVLLGSGGHRSRARRRVADRERPGAGRRGRGAGRHRRGGRPSLRRHVVQLPVQAALERTAERPLRRRSAERLRRALGGGLPLRVGGDLPLRPRGRRLHHGDDEDGRDPDRHRPAGAALPPQRLGADRDPDGASSRSAARATGCGRRRSASSSCSFRSRSRSATTAWSPRRSSSSAPARGVLASTVNPFATGVASDAAGISIGEASAAHRALVRARPARDRLRPLVRAARSRAPGEVVVGVSATDAEEAEELDRGRAGAHRPPEARARPLRRRRS